MLKVKYLLRNAAAAFAFFLAAFCLIPAIYAQSTGGVKGKVRTANGNGIANASITARKSGKDVKSVTADNKGNFVLEGLEAGTYNIVFDAPKYSAGVLYDVEVKKNKIHDLGDKNLILTPDQGLFVIVRGSVFYKEGVSLPGAKVEIEEVNADGTTRKLGSALTNISGEFVYKRPEGAAKLRVKASFKGVTGSQDIDVNSAMVYRLAITLDISRTEK